MNFLTSLASGTTLAAAGILSMFGGVHASTTPAHIHKTQNLSCIAAAVDTRETTIDADVATYTTAITAAYTTRAASLSAAYNVSNASSVEADAKAAWAAFSASIKTAKSNWQASDKGAWSTFSASAKECGNEMPESDGANASLDTGASI